MVITFSLKLDAREGQVLHELLAINKPVADSKKTLMVRKVDHPKAKTSHAEVYVRDTIYGPQLGVNFYIGGERVRGLTKIRHMQAPVIENEETTKQFPCEFSCRN